MGIVFAGIAPHGFTLVPAMSADADGALATRAAMFELGRRCAAADPEVIVVAGPHGFRVDGAVMVATVGRAAGVLKWAGSSLEMNVPLDIALANGIADTAERAGLPVARGGYGGTAGYGVIPLDWGLITPLWFLGHDRDMTGFGDVLAETPEDKGRPAVVMTPSKLVPRLKLVEFGHAVADAAAADGRRVAYIASCDWAHRHAASGPYGFHEAAARVDKAVVAAVEANALRSMLDIDPQDATDAAIDGLPQALVLAGVLERVDLKGELISYEAPSYYGMLVAAYGSAHS